MVVKKFIDLMVEKGYSPEEIKNELGKYGYRASLPALQAYVKKNPRLSQGYPLESFDKKELLKGSKVEMEHTDDPEEAMKIAMDHLVEDPDYYKKLAKMESGKYKLVKKNPPLLPAIDEKGLSDHVLVVALLKIIEDNPGLHQPDIMDVMLKKGIKSTGLLYQYLKNLQRKGYVKVSAKLKTDNENNLFNRSITVYEITDSGKKLKEKYLNELDRVMRNPSCKSAGMSQAKRKAYNQKHGSNVKKGVTNITSMDKLRRWGAWATRFYGRKDKPALVKGEYFTPLGCSAIAWGVNPPLNWQKARKIYRRGKEALDTYKTLKDKYGYSPKQKFTTKERNFLNRAFLDFVK